MRLIKKTNQRILLIAALVLTLGACEKETIVQQDVAKSETEVELKKAGEKFCDVNFAKRMQHTIVLTNSLGQKKSFKIPVENLEFQFNQVSVLFRVNKKMRNENFFKRGIVSYKFTSAKVSPKELISVGAALATTKEKGSDYGKSIIIRKGKKILYKQKISKSVGKNLSLIDLVYRVNSNSCAPEL